jgi:hypothetical protein
MLFADERVSAFVHDRYRYQPDELTHVSDVAAMARNADDFVAALLHDLVEDALASWEELEALLGDDAGRIVPALRLLTRGDEPYSAYIESIATSGNIIALNVKTLDLFDHLSPYKRATLSIMKVGRYFSALERLAAVSFDLESN